MAVIARGVKKFFKAILGWMGRHKKLSVFLALLIAAGIALQAILNSISAGQTDVFSVPDTTTLAKMDLEQTVSATGALKSGAVRGVSSELAYEVAQVYVEVGDTVAAGELLCQLDTSELQKSIAETQEKLAEAQASDKLALEQAGRKLQDAQNQQAIDTARQLETVQTAEDAKIAATDAYNAAFSAYHALPPTDPNLATAENTMTAAKAAADAADTALKEAVRRYEDTVRQDSLGVENAQDSINNLKLRDSAEQYRTQLEGYREDLENCAVTAPVAGTVTALTAEVGQSAGGGGAAAAAASAGALFTIADLTDLEISASVPEYDAVTLTVGMSAHITADAFDGQTWNGQVKSISPVADDSGNFTVTVAITSPAGSLTAGMSAKLNIVAGAKQDVYAVPYDAVTTNGQGQTVVYALAGGGALGGGVAQGGVGNMPQGFTPPESGEVPEGFTPPAGGLGQAAAGSSAAALQERIEVVVETGMETDYYIEISGDGLYDGMQILNDPLGTNVQAGAEMPGGFIMGGGLRG